jgi:DNA replication protein DnaC
MPVIIPDRFWEAEIATHKNLEIKSLLLDYLQNYKQYCNQGQAPALFGSPGIGKSYGAAALIKKLPIQSLWVPVVQKFNYLIDLRDFRKENYFSSKHQLFETQFLVMDDFGQLRDFARIRELFFEVVDYRYSWKLPTMFTANFVSSDPKDLEMEISKCFNSSLARRILTMGEGMIYCG